MSAPPFQQIKSALDDEFEVRGGLRKLLFYAGLFVVTIYGFALLAFAFFQVGPDTILGVFGDFIGGTLNPILSFLAFLGVLITISLQRKELADSREELRRSANALEAQIKAAEQQKFEASFFNMLSALDSMVAGIDLQNRETKMTQHGRDCFTTFYSRLAKFYRRNCEEYPDGLDHERITNAYQKFAREHQLELSAYFRFLYNIIRYIDESGQGQRHHIRLLRSKISDQELLVVFYNCLTPTGAKMKTYVEKYALFDNLPTLRLLKPEHTQYFSNDALGDNKMHHGRNTGLVRISGKRVRPMKDDVKNTSKATTSQRRHLRRASNTAPNKKL